MSFARTHRQSCAIVSFATSTPGHPRLDSAEKGESTNRLEASFIMVDSSRNPRYSTPLLPRSGTAVFSFLCLLTICVPSFAQQMQGCEDHSQIRKQLKVKFQEELSAIATNQYGWLVELYTSADGNSWTLVATRPNGPACVFGTGRDWQMVAPIAGRPM